MNVTILYNPVAGRGKAAAAAHRLAADLSRDAHTVELRDTGPAALKRSHDAALPGTDAMIVVGGDGSVHAAADLARRSGAPVYQFPMGTENLFAREFGMDRTYATLARALERRRIVPIDMGDCNGRSFLLMCSVGLDANVVHRLARVRTGAITHFSYARHLLLEAIRPDTPRLTIRVDGRTLVDGRDGLVVVANSRQYAFRLNPARHADMTDGLLDGIFIPCRSPLAMTAWATRLRLQDVSQARGIVYFRGTRIRIEAEPRPIPRAGAARLSDAAVYQLDGEAPGISYDRDSGPATTPLEITVRPSAMLVLSPRALATPALDRSGVPTVDVRQPPTCPVAGSAGSA